MEFALSGPPEAAFAAWTEPDEVTRWWGEAGVYRTTGWTADVRPGGDWRADFEGDGGEAFSAEGRYLAVERPSRLVWTWRASWTPETESTIDMTFVADGSDTRLKVRQQGFDPGEGRNEYEAAWRQIVGWSIAHLKG